MLWLTLVLKQYVFWMVLCYVCMTARQRLPNLPALPVHMCRAPIFDFPIPEVATVYSCCTVSSPGRWGS